MFDFVRQHTKIMMGLLFLLIIPSFVFFGLEGYTRMNEGGHVVARVAGSEIKQIEWDNAHRNEVQRMLAQTPTLDARLLDSPEAKYATLERLVRDRVLAVAADEAHLVTTDGRLARALQEDPAIASLRKPDGSLDVERYRLLVGAQGMTPEMFEANARRQISTRQVMAGVGESAFGVAAAADATFGAFLQRREVQVAQFPAGDFSAGLKPTEAELEAWYKGHVEQFRAPEQAKIEYVVLDLDAVKKNIAVNEDDLKTFYTQNNAQLAGKEERRASHILVDAPKSASADERAKAKARAEQLLAEVRKNPASFADVARKSSDDKGSAAGGGDLDYLTRSAIDKPIADAIFGLGKKGDISDVVESDFGFHVIQLTDIRAPKVPSFAEMRTQLEGELRTQQAQRQFAETAETFTNTVYEQSDSLKPVADKLKLQIQTATVTPVPAAGATGPLANARLLEAVFSADATQQKRNTEAVEVGTNQLVSARVVEHSPARTQALAEVQDQVRARWTAQRAAELAKQKGEAQLAEWKTQGDKAKLPAAVTIARDDTHQFPAKLIDAALRADPAALPALLGVDLAEQGYAVVRVDKIAPPRALPAEAEQQVRQQYAQTWAAAETVAYYNLLKERLKVRMEVAAPAGMPAQ
ncbi:SurA N-terminal domain-containing protein [Pseudorhodoferax sp. Leaf265]|jgi:peptidyl-prolyl cis-trans isomerase D|uniref:SurA N-terminal domain-containing protein n=1 Tax=Pseudorhodoferax sp. Leaf265 TaxID=1736315 RepID=UPI0006FA1707|nr:SurA N-terminal domain-containing protein [Pseudorhodoferax sp. Leaf265]KQP03107.1 peptidylprolyl isomerase [Pseudorhodoferax sp. Leaf265]PZP92634.1 MAG: peptidylprolyl isomerase [Variovorax paradoxus]PZQ03137.1 MAG: peptidylprolyl isomerase [Variovorax paradoxus]